MSTCLVVPAKRAIDDLVRTLLPGVQIHESVTVVTDPGCDIRLDTATAPTGKGVIPIPIGTFPGRVVTLPPPQGAKWIIIVVLDPESEGLLTTNLYGHPYANWRYLAFQRDDFDLFSEAGTDYFVERDAIPAKPRR